ncbi:hypothetical protein [Dyadobacter frigoris]|uniref:Uncharacterized protein n=1 Tax=Dyadobacter frigoris TaxID=2576211 RepID=A0A4U6D5X2_9BACT|nr:hypothetical protein [Dyadobacter frigoris]TKT91607.1 hypothetical protein FDK13_14665 [Dyadobacter frigoris]
MTVVVWITAFYLFICLFPGLIYPGFPGLKPGATMSVMPTALGGGIINQIYPEINARGMTDIVAAEFIPWKMIDQYQHNHYHQPNLYRNKCQRHDRYGSRGIYSVGNDRLIATQSLPSTKPIPK